MLIADSRLSSIVLFIKTQFKNMLDLCRLWRNATALGDVRLHSYTFLMPTVEAEIIGLFEQESP